MPVAVRNNEKGPSVFSDPASNIAIEWAGLGDAEGGDIQLVPDSLMSDINFMRAINRGIFEPVEMSADVQDKIDHQGEAYRERRDAAETLTESVMDRQSERPIIIGSIDEKGTVVADPNPRSADEIPVNVSTEPDVYGPEDAPPVERPATGSVVQMDEEGQPLTGEPELKVTMTEREKEG